MNCDLYSDDPVQRGKQLKRDRKWLRGTRKNSCLLFAITQLKAGRPYLVPTPEMISVVASATFGRIIPPEQVKEFCEAWERGKSLFNKDTQECVRQWENGAFKTAPSAIVSKGLNRKDGAA